MKNIERSREKNLVLQGQKMHIWFTLLRKASVTYNVLKMHKKFVSKQNFLYPNKILSKLKFFVFSFLQISQKLSKTKVRFSDVLRRSLLNWSKNWSVKNMKTKYSFWKFLAYKKVNKGLIHKESQMRKKNVWYETN